MRKIYKTSLISALVCILFFNEGAANAFEFKNPFKRKSKQQVEELKGRAQENVESETPAIFEGEEEYTGDLDAVHIKDIEIYGNNLIETSFIKGQLSSKEGYPFNRKNVANDLSKLYKSGYFTQNIRALPIKLDNGKIGRASCRERV